MLTCVTELKGAECQYHSKLHSNDKDTKSLFSAGWKVEELRQLVGKCQVCIVTTQSIVDVVSDPNTDLIRINVAKKLYSLRDLLKSFVKDLSRHQRSMATHIFVLMISTEARNSKPYALPVQCVPYHSLNTKQVRKLVAGLSTVF